MKRLCFVFVSLILAGSFVNEANGQSSGLILLKDATIIDGDASVKPVRGSILIKNGIIQKIDKNIKATAHTTVIDCRGKFITPGLFDAHIHLGTLDLSNEAAAHRHTDSVMYNMVRHGITTLRDMAGEAPFLQKLSADAEQSNWYAPSVFYAAQFAGPDYFKMMGNGRKGQPVGGALPWARSITDTTDIAAAVAEAKAAGVTGIKIYADLSAGLVRKITLEAKRQGLLAWSHAAVNPALPSDVADAGVHSMSHAGDLLFQQFPAGTDLGTVWGAIYKGLKADSATLMPVLLTIKHKRIYFDPTLFHASNNNLKNAPLIARWANSIGVRFVAGTDWIYPTTNEAVPLMEETRILAKDAGLSNAQVIEALTANAAAATGLQDRGRVRKGLRADLLILDADPMQQTDVLFSPAQVIRKGKLLTFK